MSGFLLTPMTRFYMEALQSASNAAGKTAGAKKDGTSAGGTASGQTNSVGTGTAATGQTNSVGTGTAATGQTNRNRFADAVQEKLAQKDEASLENMVSGVRNEAMVRAMSREEYKLYIYQKIAAIPMHPSQKWDAVFVNISEEGFAAMQADPAYEKWVLDTLRKDFAFYNPWSAYAGGSYRIHYFGATKQEYRGESFAMGFRNGGKRTDSSKKKKEKSFWEKRAERHKMYMDLAQKAWYKHENEQQYRETIDIQRKEVSSALLTQWAMEQITGEEVELGVNPCVLSQAATDFAQGYVFFNIPSTLINPRTKINK